MFKRKDGFKAHKYIQANKIMTKTLFSLFQILNILEEIAAL
jgi:hypothetical protein